MIRIKCIALVMIHIKGSLNSMYIRSHCITYATFCHDRHRVKVRNLRDVVQSIDSKSYLFDFLSVSHMWLYYWIFLQSCLVYTINTTIILSSSPQQFAYLRYAFTVYQSGSLSSSLSVCLVVSQLSVGPS